MESKEMSKFLQIAYKNHKIRELSEAFQEFDPKEEIHEGKTEIFLNEKTAKYDFYQICYNRTK